MLIITSRQLLIRCKKNTKGWANFVIFVENFSDADFQVFRICF
jgi:hypothetical protein